jgi:hypothetical protein
VRAGDGTPEERARDALDDLQHVLPGVADSWNKRVIRNAWDRYPWALGSYSLMKPGLYTTLHGIEDTIEGRVHFAGEQSSMQFAGYMNGAIESGQRAAREVVEALRVRTVRRPPDGISVLLPHLALASASPPTRRNIANHADARAADGEHLPDVPIGLFPIQDAAAVIGIDPEVLGPCTEPVFDARRFHTLEVRVVPGRRRENRVLNGKRPMADRSRLAHRSHKPGKTTVRRPSRPSQRTP